MLFKLGEELDNGLRILGHIHLDTVVCPVRISKEVGYLAAEQEDPLQDGDVDLD